VGLGRRQTLWLGVTDVAISLSFAADRPHNCGDFFSLFAVAASTPMTAVVGYSLGVHWPHEADESLAPPSQPSDDHQPDPESGR
jgi:hypothetical protein